MDHSIVFVQMGGGLNKKSIGGSPVFTDLLARFLIKYNINVYAVTNPSDEYGFQFLDNKRFVLKFKRPKDFELIIFDYFNLKKELNKIINKIPDKSIFITISPFPVDIMAAHFLKRKLKKKVAIIMDHITPSILFHPIRRGPIRSTLAWFISIFALVIVKFDNIPVILDNKRIAKWTGWNINEKLIIEKLSFTDYEIINPGNREGHFAVFVGRLFKNKGIKDLILAWKYVIEEIPDAKLYIIGNDRNNKYHKLILKSKLNNSIIITGFINEYDKKNILRKAKLFVFPSYEEGWGLAVMEAINFGLLPILYDIPAYDYVCDDKIKVKPGNVKELSKKIVYYFNNPEETIKTISKLQECNKKYTPEYVTQTFLNQIKDRFDI